MKSIALLTHSDWPDLSADDQLLVGPLQRHGYVPHIVLWNEGEPDWRAYDLVVIRSAWRYYTNVERYLRTVDAIEAAGVPLWNPAEVVRWSMDKKYLFALEAKGVPIVPSRPIPQDMSLEAIKHILRDTGWNNFVLKPVCGAGSNGILRGTIDTIDTMQADIRKGQHAAEYLLQPLMDEVATDGEYSFVFIGGEYSHAVKKAPVVFHTARESGGNTVAPIQPSAAHITQAQRMYDALPKPLLYARLDTVDVQGALHLIEAEVNETRLYFSEYPPAVERFIAALQT